MTKMFHYNLTCMRRFAKSVSYTTGVEGVAPPPFIALIDISFSHLNFTSNCLNTEKLNLSSSNFKLLYNFKMHRGIKILIPKPLTPLTDYGFRGCAKMVFSSFFTSEDFG